MCGGLWNNQSRRSPRLLDHMKLPPAAPPGADALTYCSRHYPASPPAAGLAIVAALQAELVQSGSATSVRSSTSSSTSSLPIPISSSSSTSLSSEEESKDHFLFDPKDRGAQKPTIFSTSFSPPSSYDIVSCTSLCKELSFGDFLGVCFSCKRPLGPGKDIYMYRGDQAFCSIECRYNHIAADESLHCSIHINQQCVQASSPIFNSEVTPLIAVPILV